MKNPMQETRMLLDRHKREMDVIRGKMRKLHEEQLVLEGQSLALSKMIEELSTIVDLSEGWTCSPPKESK